MKKWCFIIVFVMAIVLVGCASPTDQISLSSDNGLDYDKVCPTGVTAYEVPLNDETDVLGPLDAFIVRPNSGCNLPTLYCIVSGYSDGHGESCVEIDN